MNNPTIAVRRLLLAGAALGALAQPAAAQSTATLDEVVVTAERRESDIQRTPIAVTAVQAEDLRRQGIVDLLNAVDTAPSVQVQSANTGSAFYIRGIGARATTGAGPVSIYQDGVYVQVNEVTNAAFADSARVEVLRGPQGTLYGRNANAGAVNLITNDPVLADFSGRITGQVGNYNAMRGEAVANVPLGDSFALRIVGGTNQHDGYLSNGLADADAKLIRVKGLWQPSERFSLLGSVEYLWREEAGPGNVLLPASSRSDPWTAPAYGTLRTIPAGELIFCSPNCVGSFDVKNMSYRLQADYDLGWSSLTYIGALQDFERRYHQPFSGLWEGDFLPLDQSSHELRLSSSAAAPIQWVAGLYHLNQDFSGHRRATYTFNQLTYWNTDRSDSAAAFGQVTVPVTDALRLTGGLRYTRDSFDLLQSAGTVSAAGVEGALVVGTRRTGEYDKVTYRAGVEYDLLPESLLYAQYSTGFRAGGVDPSGGLFNPEEIEAFEVGLKNRFLSDRLQLNLAAYYYQYSGYQLQYYVYLNGGSQPTFVTTNVPGTTDVYGVEGESAFALTANDRVSGSVSFQESKFGDATIFTSCTPAGVCTAVALGGRSLPRTPRWTVTAAYEHRFDLPSGGALTAGVNGQFKSAYQVDLIPFRHSRQGAYTLWNARLSYDSPDEGWSLSGFISNIGNEAVLQQANTAGPVDVFGVLADPRTYGVSLSARF